MLQAERQSRALSAVEATTNVVVGFGLAVLVQLAVFPAVGLSVALADHLRLALVFTAVSLVRGYALRRLFERWR